MNIFGRVFGGLLVLVSLGWLASIANLRPGGLASNQIDGNQKTGTTNLNVPTDGKANGKTAVSSAKPGTQVGASKFTTGQTASGQTTPGKPEVEANPRGVGNGTKAVGQNTTGQNTTTPETAPVATPSPKTAPVAAGW